MAEPHERDAYIAARREAAELIGIDIERACPADAVRIDTAMILRRVLDGAAEGLFRGEAVDLPRLLAAVERLHELIPKRVQPQTPEDDPRKILFAEYKAMRERGELSLELIEQAHEEKAAPENDRLRARVAELEAENERLRSGGERAITPPLSDVVPACERAECDPGPRPGPDDPPPKSTLIIDGKPVRNPKHPAPRRTGILTDDAPEPWRDYVVTEGGMVGGRKYWGPV